MLYHSGTVAEKVHNVTNRSEYGSMFLKPHSFNISVHTYTDACGVHVPEAVHATSDVAFHCMQPSV